MGAACSSGVADRRISHRTVARAGCHIEEQGEVHHVVDDEEKLPVRVPKAVGLGDARVPRADGAHGRAVAAMQGPRGGLERFESASVVAELPGWAGPWHDHEAEVVCRREMGVGVEVFCPPVAGVLELEVVKGECLLLSLEDMGISDLSL